VYSGKYLNVNYRSMSQEYGCCELNMSETTENSWFVFEPITSYVSGKGNVINYRDYFNIRSMKSVTPFYLHVFMKPTDTLNHNKSFLLNAS
jgi:hypothetical protein